MRFVSVRLPASEVHTLVRFYERLTGTSAEWANDEFAELVLPGATIAVTSQRLTDLFAAGSVLPAANASVMFELLVDDVDAHRNRVAELGEVLMEPTTLPWGNRSMLLKDPDGNIVNLFTPATPEAIAKFEKR